MILCGMIPDFALIQELLLVVKNQITHLLYGLLFQKTYKIEVQASKASHKIE